MARRVDPTADRVCKACQRLLPADKFYCSGTGNGRRRTCTFCLNKAAKTGSSRHARYNSRGEVWCNRCSQYRHREHFRPHPQRPHTLWSYCNECVRVIDRERYHKTKFRADKAAGSLERTKRKRQRREVEHRERIDFVLKTIDTVRRRGFTLTETCKLLRVALTQVYKWQAGEQLPTPQVASRCAEILRATSHIPTGNVPAFRRRLPHPELAALLERTDGLEERHPVRNRWRARA